MFLNFYNLFNDSDEKEEKKEEIRGPAAPSCYGCVHMVASPVLDCTHPNSVRVLWDPLRNRSYRIPSIAICRENSGLCKFYDPSPERGVEYHIMKEYEEKEKESVKTLDDRVNDLVDSLEKEGNLNRFLNKLNARILDDIEKEEAEENDEKE